MTKKIIGRNAAYKKQGGPKGRPPTKGGFKKGRDSRRNKHGQRNAASVAFFKQLRELIVKEGEKLHKGKDEQGQIVKLKKVEWMIKVLWQAAMKGESWAIQFIAERVEGKISQPIDLDANITFQASEKFMPKTDNEKKRK